MAKLTKKEKEQLAKGISKHWGVITIFVVLIVAMLVLAYFMGWLDRFFKKDEEPPMSQAGGFSQTVTTLEDLKINFLDIGQGDCIIIEFPDGRNMIIDSGDESHTDERKEQDITPKDTIKSFTDANNIDTFDYVLLTHSDSDHSANMSWVIDNYNVKYIFRPATFCNDKLVKDIPMDFNKLVLGSEVATNDNYANFIISAYNSNAKSEIFNKNSDFSNEIIYGDKKYSYSFDFLTPVANKDEISYSNLNDYSPLLLLEYGGRKVMFTGDAEKAVIKEYLDNYTSGHNIDVLKVGHHGSKTSTTDAFLDAIDPEYAIIQCGENNTHTHPDLEVLNMLYNYEEDLEVYRNDNNGHIVLTISETGDMKFTLENDDITKNDIDGEGVKVTLQSPIYSYFKYAYYKKELVA